jgi:16S rRNA (cytidine1402-2'-O)-methyltransferase
VWQAREIVLRRQDDAPLLERSDAASSAAMAAAGASAHFNEDQRARGVACTSYVLPVLRVSHDQIDLTAAAPRRFEIARHQQQACAQQMLQSQRFAAVASLFCRYALFERHETTIAVKADYSQALQAAQAAASSQHYPTGALYMLATPIGNLADISLRALHVLQLVDAIACEDTRHTQGMLSVYGLSKPLLALHEHNEREAAQALIARLQAGERIAYVSDAGTPAVSDPGARLAASVREAGLRIVPLPGASSITALLSCAGMSAADGAFVFQGFLPSKAKERESQVMQIAQEQRAVILLEAPHRIDALLSALSALGERPVTVGRELTKQFEEVATLPAHALPAWLTQDAHRAQGEFALAIHPQQASSANSADVETERILKLLLAELPTKTAVKLTAEITGAPRNALYDRALQLKDAE